MKNRSSNNGSGVNSSSIHGLSSVASNHHNAAMSFGDINSGSSFLHPDEYHDGDNLESQRLLNNDTSDTVNNNNTNLRNFKFLPIPISILFLSSILVFYIGWYGPRKLMDQYIDAIIARNTPPYQIIQTDSKKRIIILDSTYNHPVIEPPKISSSFLIITSVTLPLLVLCVWPFVALLISNVLPWIVSSKCMNSLLIRRLSSCGMTATAKQKENLQMNCITETLNRNSSSSCTTRCSKMYYNGCLLALYECVIIISGLLCAIGIAEGITQCAKMYIGRLRPNMYQLCQFNVETLQYSTSITKERIREGHLSFPSGHSSLASVSMIYCTWYFLYCCNNCDRTLQQQRRSVNNNNYRYSNNALWILLLSSLSKLFISLLLPGWAVYVGLTRIVDHWHHVSDVLAGLLLGSLIGTMVFHCIIQPVLQCVTSGCHSNEIRSYEIRNDEHSKCSTDSTIPESSMQLSSVPVTKSTNNPVSA